MRTTKEKLSTLLIILCLCSCQEKELDVTLQNELFRTLNDAQSWVENHGEYWLNYTRYELESPSRQKFLPVLAYLDSIDRICRVAQQTLATVGRSSFSFEERALTKKEVERTKSLLDSLKQQLSFHYHELLQNNQKQFGFRAKEVTIFKARLDETLAQVNSHSFWDKTLLLSVSEQQLAIRILQTDWLNLRTSLINELGAERFLGCNRSIYLSGISMEPHQNSVQRNDTFKARISFTSNDFNYDHRPKKLFIDGVQLPLIARSYVEYISEPLTEKEKTITITGLLKNELTGIWEEAFPVFQYNIRTE